MIIQFKPVNWVGACAITVFPIIFVDPGIRQAYDRKVPLGLAIIRHEKTHLAQQKRWLIWGLGVGLIAWWLAYLLFLPVGWNPFRRKWETEAMRAEGRQDAVINKILKEVPYYLWWS
jgi:hypothetical protein